MVLKLLELAPEGTRITLFGSAPLQISLDRSLASADVDLFSEPDLKSLVEAHGLGPKQSAFYVQVCHALNFASSPRWPGRAARFEIQGRTLIVPHPIDILIAKLHRLEEKDMKAFHVVRERTGHPTEEEMRAELIQAVDLYRPGFDEEGQRGDILANTRRLWIEFFGRDIDVRAEIIRPALELRRQGYEPDAPRVDYKQALRG